MKSPSIGALPRLCVAGGCVKCRFVLASINPTDHSMVLISGSQMSSFISAARIILSPSACHSFMALSMSWRNSFLEGPFGLFGLDTLLVVGVLTWVQMRHMVDMLL